MFKYDSIFYEGKKCIYIKITKWVKLVNSLYVYYTENTSNTIMYQNIAVITTKIKITGFPKFYDKKLNFKGYWMQ